MAKKKKPQENKAKSPVRAGKKKLAPTNRTKQELPKRFDAKARVSAGEILRRAAIAALALLMVFGVVLTASAVRSDRLRRKITLNYVGMLEESCVLPIELSDEQVRERVRATKRHGDTHAFSYFCTRTLQLDPNTLNGYILFGNPADNDCDLVLSIFDEKDNLIFRSGGLQPGKYITLIRPNVDEWERGEYACKAVVTAYSGHDITYKCIGAQYSRLNVKVGESS